MMKVSLSNLANNILKNTSIISDIAENTFQGAIKTTLSATEFRSMSLQLQSLVQQLLLDELKKNGVKVVRQNSIQKVSETTADSNVVEDDDIFF